MGVRKLTHATKVAEWQERIRTCRSSGMSVTRWCTENQISPRTYTRWERICLAEATQQLGYTEKAPGLVRIDPDQLPTSMNSIHENTAAAELVIRCGNITLEINSEMPVARIADLVSALNSHV